MIKAIETIYNGYRFRSRLEARWAVFFDEMRVKYRYETEGFDLGEINYLPDFYLPEQKLWLEVKPEKPSKRELNKAQLLKSRVDHDVTVGILHGEPWVIFDSDFPSSIIETSYCLMLLDAWVDNSDNVNCLFSECRRCGKFLYYETITSHCPDSQYADGYDGYGCCDRMGLTYTDNLKRAYSAARQARFEHGEKPR